MRSGTSSSSLTSSSFSRVSLRLALLSTSLIAGGLPIAAHAQSAAPGSSAQVAQTNFNVPPQALDSALTSVADQGGIRIFFTSAEVAGVRSNGASGAMTVEQALSQVLTGTGFIWRFQQDRTVVIERVPQTQGAITLGPVRVEGGAEGTAGSSSTIPPTAMIGNIPEPFEGGQVATGTRLGVLGNRSIFDTPFSTQGFTDTFIRDQQARSLGDVLANNPSIQAINPRTSSAEFYSIRGFTAGPGDFSFDGLFGVIPDRMASIVGVERVEVLLGASAVLNGMPPFASPGGTVNLVPARATDVPLTRVTALYESRANLGMQAEVGRRFGRNKEFGVRGSFLLRDGETAVKTTDYKQVAGALGLDYRGDRVRLSLDAGFLLSEVGPQTLSFGVLGGFDMPKPPEASQRIFPSDTFSETRGWYVAMRGEYDISDNVTASVGYGKGDGREDGIFAGPIILDTAGRTQYSPSRGRLSNTGETVDASIRANISTGPINHNAVIAAGILWTNFGNQSISIGPVEFGNLYQSPEFSITSRDFSTDIPRLTSTKVEGVTFSDTLSMLGERLQLTLGARQQRLRQESFNATGNRTAVYEESALVPLFALLVKPTEQLSLYGNYVEGLSVGPVAPVGTVNAGEAFPPFKSAQREIGAKYDFGRFAATFAGFEITLPTGIVDAGTQRFGIDGETRTRGLELNVFGEPIPGTRILAGVTHFDARQERTESGINDGNRSPGVPRYQATANLEQDIAAVTGLTLTTRVVFASQAFVDASERQPVSSWARLDLGARQSFEVGDTSLTARLSVQNVLGSNYWIARSSIGGQTLLGSPRTVQFSISAEF